MFSKSKSAKTGVSSAEEKKLGVAKFCKEDVVTSQTGAPLSLTYGALLMAKFTKQINSTVNKFKYALACLSYP